MYNDLKTLISICFILLGILLGLIFGRGIDSIYGKVIDKDDKINIDNVKYRIINIEKVKDSQIILTINNIGD